MDLYLTISLNSCTITLLLGPLDLLMLNCLLHHVSVFLLRVVDLSVLFGLNFNLTWPKPSFQQAFPLRLNLVFNVSVLV